MSAESVPSVHPSAGTVFDVRAFGARGDGEVLDRDAIQAAIDAAHAKGGGVAYLPPGRYRTGTVVLKDNVCLYLEAGAVLWGSAHREDYLPQHPFSGPGANHKDYCAEHLVYAHNARNTGIEGPGRIDGNGKHYHGAHRPGWTHLEPAAWRPVRLIAFVGCANVTLRDVEIVDAPGWTVWPYDCDGVKIQGVRIVNARWGPNTDGLDIDSSRNVFVSDCYLECGDDSIALKSSAGLLPGERACENITVTNCVLVSTTCGVRVGFEGDHPMRNCTFTNLVMSRCRTGICIQAPTAPEYHIVHGVPMENIRFANIEMDTRLAFFLYVGDESKAPCTLRNVSLTNLRCTTERGCFVGGSKSLPIENIELSDIDLTVYGPMDGEFLAEVPYPYRVWDWWNKRGIPHAIFCRHAKDLRLRNVRVRWQEGGPQRTVTLCTKNDELPHDVTVGGAEGSWASALRCESVQDLSVENFVSRVAPGPVGAPPLHLKEVRGAVLSGCRYAYGAEAAQPFVKVEGAGTGGVNLNGKLVPPA